MLKEQHWRELSLEVAARYIYDCMLHVTRIDEDAQSLDDFERAQLLSVIASATELGRRLRRSPRRRLTMPLRLMSVRPKDSWEEKTETILVSRCGALFRSKQPLKRDQLLQVMRNEEGKQAYARVAWCSYKTGPDRQFAIEILEQDNFWGLEWKTGTHTSV
jgi:hypothetical protein